MHPWYFPDIFQVLLEISWFLSFQKTTKHPSRNLPKKSPRFLLERLYSDFFFSKSFMIALEIPLEIFPEICSNITSQSLPWILPKTNSCILLHIYPMFHGEILSLITSQNLEDPLAVLPDVLPDTLWEISSGASLDIPLRNVCFRICFRDTLRKS